eukprot:SAG31_NODE_31950_length_362_cov_0.608365_1_plen_40_part_01
MSHNCTDTHVATKSGESDSSMEYMYVFIYFYLFFIFRSYY